jgi:uncharacterized protein (TIGR02246 family)
MKTRLIFIILMGFSMAATIPVASQSLSKKQSAEIATIKQMMANADAAYDKKDAAAYVELYKEDADFLWTTGVLSKDRNEIQQQVVNSFKLIPSGYKHISTLERIRFLKPDIAIGDGTSKFVREGASENEKPFWIARSTCVYKKEKGQWRCSAVRLIPMQSE